MSKQYKAEILSRIYLKNPRPADCFNLAIEIITHYQDVPDKDCIRLIDLNSGEVFIESEYFADAQEIIDYASKLYSSHDRIYKTGWTRCDKPKKELRTFSDLPIKDQIRHIESHARDL